MIQKRYKKTVSMVVLAMFFAVAMVLSYIEHLLPPIPMLPPGVKLGLSNIVVMYCLFFLGTKKAVFLAVLKSGFVLFTRGVVAMLLSFSGGIASVMVMAAIIMMCKGKCSALTVSVAGGITHNIGQFIVVSIMFSNFFVLAYLPILILSGIVSGVITSVLLKSMLPIAKKLNINSDKSKEDI